MDPIIELLINNAPTIISWLITVGVGAIAVGQYKIIKDVLELSQDLAVFYVLKGRVTADGVITTTEGNLVINAGFEFLTKLEKIIGTYILNRPETGWLKGSVPEFINCFAELKKPDPDEPVQSYQITPDDSNVTPNPILTSTTDQNQNPVIQPAGAVTP